MRILGIDTAGAVSSVALVEGGGVRAMMSAGRLSPFGGRLLRLIDVVCTQAGIQAADLDGIAVNIGPGSFTGLRVGVATAQGLALATGKPVVGCSAFAALAAQVSGWEGAICPVLEARRGEVYAAFYRCQGPAVVEVVPGMVLRPERLCAQVTDPTLFLGSGVVVYGATLTSLLGQRAICVKGNTEGGLAVSVAFLGQAYLSGAAAEGRPAPRPLYIRAADAQPRPYAVATGESAIPEVSSVRRPGREG